MIVLTFKATGRKNPIAILGPTRGIGSFIFEERGISIGDMIRLTMQKFRNEQEFLYVDPGAVLHTPMKLFSEAHFDVAAYVERIGTPLKHGPFDGIGRMNLSTVFFRNSEAAKRVLDRWIERTRIHGKPDSEGLLLALSEIPATFLHFPPEYAWIEASMRPFHPAAEPVIEHYPDRAALPNGEPAPVKAAAPKKEPIYKGSRPAEVLWAGHLYDYSGYGKANREMIFRVANSINVRLDTTHQEPVAVSEYERSRLDAFKGTLIGEKAPLLRFFGPDFQTEKNGRHRIVWTMMETYKAHPDMVKLINEEFDELWTPTEWNRQVFVDSGVKVLSRTVPLGVNTLIYRIMKRQKLPPCRLLSTSKAGAIGVPEGFIFLSVGLPSFRKGFDAIANAMDKVFARKSDVHFVIALTHSLPDWNHKVYQQFASYKSRIWALEGKFDEHALARIYNACDCYVSASRGEGWNLPVCEASACGLPVICPDNTSHPFVVGKDAFMFKCDPPARCPEVEAVSGWYREMPFSVIGKKSVDELAELMRFVHSKDSTVRLKTVALRNRMLTEWTWDKSAEFAAFRLMEVQP